MQLDATTVNMLVERIQGTIYVISSSSALFYVIGIPLGTALVVTSREGIGPVPLFNKVLGLIVNLLRSVPFIILLTIVLPVTRFIVGRTIGFNATVAPLIIAAAPYIGRIMKSSLREVDTGVVEAAKSMSAPTWQIIVKVLLPEAKPSLLVGTVISATAILGRSVMARFTEGDGLGDIAIRYEYRCYQADMITVTVVLLVIIVQLVQEVAMRMPRKSGKRIRQRDSGIQSGKRVREQNPGNPVTKSRKKVPWYKVICGSAEAVRFPDKERVTYMICI